MAVAGEGRGREPFVPVSWERALDLVAGELSRVKRDYGHDAIMAGSQGWGWPEFFTKRAGNCAGSWEFSAASSIRPRITALAPRWCFCRMCLGSAGLTGPLTSWSSVARHARLMVLFGGANQKNMQVTKGGMGRTPSAIRSPGSRVPA